MEHISKRNKYTYSVGCIGRDMMFILVSMFILVYIQYTIGLTVSQFAVISGIMIFARVWDAVNDPMMGLIIENSHFKSGKFRPWIIIGGAANCLTTILLFTLRPSGWLFVIFFGIAYIAWGMTYTMNDISYWSLLPNLARNNEERNGLTTLVVTFASIGQFLAGGLIPILVTGNAVMMYKIIGISISIIFFAFTCLTYFGVKEAPRKDDKKEKVTIKQMFRILFKNNQLVAVTIAILLHTIAVEVFIGLGMNFFYFEFGYGGEQMTIFTVFFGLGTLASLGMFPILTKKFNRMKIMGISIIISIIGYIVFLSLGYIIPMFEAVLYMSAFFVFFGINLFFVALIVMAANTIEYNELLTGDRNESIIFSVRPFMTKLGAAIQQGIVTITLLASGVYVYSQQIADLEIQKAQGLLGDITVQANQILAEATSTMRLVLRIGMGVVPMLAFLGAYIIIRRKYIISEEKYEEILAELSKR